MTWTFDPSLSTDLAKVRDAIGDVDTDDQQLADETITAYLTAEGSVTGAAVRGCRALMAKYARYAAQATGPINIQYTQLQAHYAGLIDQIKAGQFAAPFAGGTSIADKEDREADGDRVQPVFSLGMLDHPDAGASS